MNRKDFHYTNDKDPLRGKTVFLYDFCDHYKITTLENEKMIPCSISEIEKFHPSYVVLFDVNYIDEEKAERLRNKFDCKLPMGFMKGLCGKYNEEDPTNSDVDYLAYYLLSDDIELIESLCKDYEPYKIVTIDDSKELDIFGVHIPSSFFDSLRMYNINEVYYGYMRKTNNK